MPYDLPPVDYADLASTKSAAALQTLGAWYSQAQVVLDYLVAEFGAMAVTQPTVRCWPHHYDLATLFVLEEGDPETVRSIGLGLSPGDESYAEPYFYCTPWPPPNALPEPPAPLCWHTKAFTSLVCPASRIDQQSDLGAILKAGAGLARAMLQADNSLQT